MSLSNAKNTNLASVTAATPTDLYVCGAGKTAALVSIIACNYSTSASAIAIWVADSSNVELFKIIDDAANNIAVGETVFVDSKVFLKDGDKIRVQSSEANVSFGCNAYEE